jgi:hypothetical protein
MPSSIHIHSDLPVAAFIATTAVRALIMRQRTTVPGGLVDHDRRRPVAP